MQQVLRGDFLFHCLAPSLKHLSVTETHVSSLSGETWYTVTQMTGSQMWALALGQASRKLGDMINKTAKGGLRSPHSSSRIRAIPSHDAQDQIIYVFECVCMFMYGG